MRNLVAAIELGTTKVVCAVAERTSEGLKVLTIAEGPSKGISHGEIVNIQNITDSISPVIKKAEENVGTKINDVFVGVSGQYVRTITKALQMTRPNSEELITVDEINIISNSLNQANYPNNEIALHVVPQTFNIDNFMGITDPIGMIGKSIDANFKVITGKAKTVQYNKKVIENCGLNMCGIIPNVIASATSVLSDEELEVGVALLDIGGGTTDLLVIKDNIIRHAAIIPFGGNAITEDIRICCGISAKVAEFIKINNGSCYGHYTSPTKKVVIRGVNGREDKSILLSELSEIIEARVAEILEAADYEIERSGYKNTIRGGIVITGGTSRMGNLTQLATTITGLTTRVAMPINICESEETYQVYKPELSTVLGILLHGSNIISLEEEILDDEPEYGNPDGDEPELFKDVKDQEKRERERVKREKNKESGSNKGFMNNITKSLRKPKLFSSFNPSLFFNDNDNEA